MKTETPTAPCHMCEGGGIFYDGKPDPTYMGPTHHHDKCERCEGTGRIKSTFNNFAMNEDRDWYAFPAVMTRHQVASELVYNVIDWWLDEHEAVYRDEDDRLRGWITAYRDLLSKLKVGYVRLAEEGDDYDTYYDEWWFECERDHPKAEMAWIVKL